jgi:hypothetical protein
MSWTATPRYGLDLAPSGLAFVHDFLNTASGGRPRQVDLLSDTALATQWLRSALAAWGEQWGLSGGPEVQIEELTARDLTMLRRLRAHFMASLRVRYELDAEDDGAARAAELPAMEQLGVAFEAGILPDGTVYFVPAGSGWKRVLGPLLLEVRRAQDAGTWARLKSCKNDRCCGVFYDRSRNNSGVWHDVRTCGNVANLRASRERRRAAASEQRAG